MTIPFFSCLLFITSQFTQKILICLLFMFLFQSSSFTCVSGQCLNDQRSLLLQLKNTLTYNSSLSTKLVQWNNNTDCCNWNGVECDNIGHVIGLELDNETISRGIKKSSALYGFWYLENLNLADNNFNYKQIPSELGHLTNLVRLNLSHSEFAGKIPVELSQMTSLFMLDLSSNFLLEYPNLKNFVQNLTRLEELHLDWVDFKQKGDWWEALSLALPNLLSLSLTNCGLSGRLNSSFLQLHSLSVLRLDENYLSDTSLDFFENFRNLTVLSLSYCSLQGAFPARIFQVPTLQYLDLSFNYRLTETIPEFPPGSSLRTLILKITNFSGSLTDSIINLSNLSMIDIPYCNFTGPIPSTVGKLSKLVYLDFSSNSFTGSIPIFSMPNKLEYINLSFNGLNGSLSSTQFEGLSNLQYLYLNDNSLKGNIPTSLFILPSLQELWLFDNKFSGQVNEFPTLNSSLVTLHLQRNQLEGLIPKSFFILPSLQELWLSDNKFSGQVNEFPTLNSSLEELYLQRNQLEGLIPKSFFRLEKLIDLDLSLNFFNGTIQFEDFQTLQNLRYLQLGYNHLSVNINILDSEFSSFPQLKILDLASCNLSRFPNLRNQTDLNDLDLSNNKISGDIPSWIWEVGNGSFGDRPLQLNLSHNFLMNLQTPYQIPSSIGILDLHSNMLRGELPVFQLLPTYVDYSRYVDYSSNHFQGHIPVDIGRNFTSNHRFFSVANNSLTGEIPISLCNIVNIEVLDFSGNLLSGGLPPCLVKNLTRLGVLNIGRNYISGSIPDVFPVDCSLSTLDLSMNNLRGNIPPSLANCKSLQVMNVASNNLHGTFPCILMNSSSLHVLLLRSNKFSGDIRCPGLGHNLSNLQIIDIAFNSFTGFLDSGFISSWSSMKLKNSPRLTGDPLGFSIEGIFYYYRDTVTVTLKGQELEFAKILTVMTSIDFSSNKFQGAIPETFGELSSLHVLNLSHNSFTSTILKSLGNLTNLESLDLSANRLTGNIPTELVSLIFLSFFNVSYNELVGRIPSGRQFLTFSAASYEGNLGLCGFPVNQSCGSYIPKETSPTSTGKKEVDWMFMLAGLGYAMGVALVVVPPLFSRRWGERWDEHQVKFMRLICPRFRG